MSDLIITLDGLRPPPEACAKEPPAANNPKTTVKDECHITLPLIDPKKPKEKPRSVRFDREGDKYVLSNQNISKDLTWVGEHKNLQNILDVLRLTDATIRSFDKVDSGHTNAIKVMLAQFIVTGVIQFPKGVPFKVDATGSGKKSDLANYLLGTFTISRPNVIQKLLGALTVFRRDQALTTKARERIKWVNSILDLVSKHKTFRKYFIGDLKVDPWRDLSEKTQNILRPLFNLSRKAVVYHWMGFRLRWDPDVLAAYRGYQKLNPQLKKVKQVASFCHNLASALSKLRGHSGGSLSSLSECRQALDLLELKPEMAIKESLRQELFSDAGFGRLQQLIKEESASANMRIEWLHKRGRVRDMAKIFFNSLNVKMPGLKSGSVEISLDVPSLTIGMDLKIAAQVTKKREYVLAVLALLRYFIGSKGKPPPLKVFIHGNFSLVPWKLSSKNIEDLRGYITRLEKSLNLSHQRSDRVLPLAEGITCAVGGLSVLGFETTGNPDSNLHRGLNLTSYSVAGAGCTALAGHYLWPKIAKGKVRNHYLWDGATGLAGAVVGAGLYFLIHSYISPYQDPSRNPVDEYGP